VLFLALLVFCSWAQTGGKKVVKSDDLPRFVYPVNGIASALVEADAAAFNAFAAKVQTDLDSIFRDYEISDKATLRELLNAGLELQMLADEYQPALVTLDQLSAEPEKPSAKLTIGIYERAWLQSGIDTKSTSGQRLTSFCSISCRIFLFFRRRDGPNACLRTSNRYPTTSRHGACGP
jgi:hypothetical protein